MDDGEHVVELVYLNYLLDPGLEFAFVKQFKFGLGIIVNFYWRFLVFFWSFQVKSKKCNTLLCFKMISHHITIDSCCLKDAVLHYVLFRKSIPMFELRLVHFLSGRLLLLHVDGKLIWVEMVKRWRVEGVDSEYHLFIVHAVVEKEQRVFVLGWQV